MGYNHSKEEKKFKEEWKNKELLYRQNGMTDEQIKAIKEFDERSFKLDRAFYRRTTLLAEYESLSDSILYEFSDSYLEEYWTEFIDSDDKYSRLMKVPLKMRKAFFMYKVIGLHQSEISSKLSIPQRTISYWIVKITEILK